MEEITNKGRLVNTIKKLIKSLVLYLAITIGKITVIVFSVTLSIGFNNWNIKEKNQRETIEFLQAVKSELKLDIKNMSKEVKVLERSIIFSNRLLSFSSKELDSIGAFAEMTVNLNTRKNFDANYQGFKSSGKLGHIKDPELKGEILSYYQKKCCCYR